MNRRQFVGNLFNGIVVANAAPSLIIPQFGDSQIWKPSRQIYINDIKSELTRIVSRIIQDEINLIMTLKCEILYYEKK